MKNNSNPSRCSQVDILILLCLVYVINSAFISTEGLKGIDIIGEVSTSFYKISGLNFKAFLIEVVWYLFFYILLEITSKVLSLLELMAKVIGKPIRLNLKLLNKYCTLLLLLLGGKFLIFVISSLF